MVLIRSNMLHVSMESLTGVLGFQLEDRSISNFLKKSHVANEVA